ncbi:hypothetical protein P154DRAFT_43109 [Amniculicola lignicola CBS 123094]|uniref:Zn(2)-C6 fungal-type domain-containing protein n=1 Tax=Amniculicola lignicola CBS 123094 TaxID=1392246 RepID=A0A6A5WTM0_9PLEO|nr:hypothetical protein P154DRAFT_43109 [Amniculicola lignicola CBS 123094]
MSETKVYKKRPHRKAKTGCATCKRRKIKCDEEKPQCANCARYSSECVYPSHSDLKDTGSISASTTPPLARTPEYRNDEPRLQFHHVAHELPMRDLTLMHQWAISTCHGFGEFPGDSDPWQIDIPIQGQQYPFLMRGILAVAAAHLAKMTSDPAVRYTYVELAAYHHDLALPDYRSAIQNVTEQNITAVLAFSTLTTVHSLAAPRDITNHQFGSRIYEWMFLHKGVGDIPPHWLPWIDSGPLKGQLRRRRLQPIEPTFNPDDYRLVGLHALLMNLSVEEQHEGVHYEEALFWLRQAFVHTISPASVLGNKYAVLYWVEHLPQGFMDLLRLERPRALILLAHCCVLLKRAEAYWYMEGSAENILMEIKPFLGEEFLPWIEWPLQICGLG